MSELPVPGSWQWELRLPYLTLNSSYTCVSSPYEISSDILC